MFRIKPSTKRKMMRVVAMYVALNMIAQYIIPMRAFALTGGPSQPEVESFEPVSTTDMVNLFSGDFNYNIPLLNVPGPNGGYPINLAYHAGVGMEQEASWVGLGWNINPGVINRNMRGLPDDFDGDVVKKTMYYKPQETWMMDYKKFDISTLSSVTTIDQPADDQASEQTEWLGLENRPVFSYQLHFNNYTGIGYGMSMNLTTSTSNILSSHFSGALNISYDTDGGFGVIPSLSYNRVKSKIADTYSTTTSTISFGYNSHEGLSNLSLRTSKSVTDVSTSKYMISIPHKGKMGQTTYDNHQAIFSHYDTKEASPGSGITFISHSSIPNNNLSVNGSNIQLGITIGKVLTASTELKKEQKKRFSLSYTETKSNEIDKSFASFGFHYYQDAQYSSEDYLLDFDREKNNPANKNASSIAVGYGTPDMLSVSGQGISGVFKPFRSESPIFYDASVINQFAGANVGLEIGQNGIGDQFQLESGGDLGVNYSRSYSGDWNSLASELSTIHFEGYSGSDPLFEPAYYKSSGEMTASPIDEMAYVGGESALRFDLRNVFDADNGILPKVVDQMVTNYLDNTPLSLSGNNKRTTRQKRAQLMYYRMSGQIDSTTGYGHSTVKLYNTVNDFPSTGGTSTTLDYADYPAHHIGEVTVNNADGYRYVYGLPAYNNKQKEVMFTKDGVAENTFNKTETYIGETDNNVGNSQGEDHFFMSTEIPKYAYSYLITAIYSPDYVDLTGDGPSDDDFGYWVKFNYTKAQSDFGWRIPYRDANYSKNHISDVNDDKLNYMYGTKEVYYLNSVETKTHEARFILNSGDEVRHDANGVPTENFLTATSMGTANQLHYLKSIELVSKKDPNKIIKTVHFEYDYSLCGGTNKLPNNDGVSETVNSVNINANKGKLTLKKVWFSYLGNSKGELSPYVFQYTHDSPTTYDNPDYSQDYMDRWGYFKPDQTINGIQVYAKENPYVNQSAYNNDPNDYMCAWNLKKITLPSGGTIKINYESDDYAYVQNKQAMQMQEIVGTGPYTSVTTDGQATSNGNKFNDRNTIIFFNLEKTFDGTGLSGTQMRDSILPYVKGIDQFYFKVYEKLKRKVGHTGSDVDDFSYDYVEGYADIDKSQSLWYGYGAPDGNGIVTTGWVRVKNIERNPWNPIGQTDHPFKLAGWQYLRLERPDLFDDGNLFNHNDDITSVIGGFINIANNFQRLFGYFNFCQSHSYCNEFYIMDHSTSSLAYPKPSYIRLNTPDGRKYGGGHRVKDIRITDGWENMSNETSPTNYEYGIEYQYVLPDGTSSGVAEYEPLIGGEEIPQRIPLRYQERKYPYKNDGLYAEEPFGESLYPAANVGYSRVIAKSISHNNVNENGDDVTKNRSGISVTEFYTAKDFPVFSDYTDLKKKNFAIPVIIPFIGEISYNNKGYSQGFSLELNNMHGQLKSQAVYSAFANIYNQNEQPVSKTEYIYQTVDPYSPTPDKTNRLSNEVQVLDADGVYRTADIGKTHEFYIDRQQHSNFSVSAGVQINAGAEPPYVFWGNLFPYFEISRAMYRSISTLKVIERNGVLAEVKSYKDGAFTDTKSLMYDAETGQPLLTQSINNFDKPIYTYNYASHWAYNSMGGGYQNIGARFSGINVTSGIFHYTNAQNYFVPGDELELNNANYRTIYWVTDVDASTGNVTIIDEDGNLPSSISSGLFTITRSGRRNQQESTNGTIVALANPVTNRHFNLFDAFNAYDASGIDDNSELIEDFYTDCITGHLVDMTISWDGDRTLSFAGNSCEAIFVFPEDNGIENLHDAFNWTLSYVNGVATATNGETTLNCTWSAPACFASCLEDVLHAEAYRFADNWSFNYADLGDPEPAYATHDLSGNLSGGVLNDYRFGTKGIWRLQQSWLYQIDRKQSFSSPSGTDISKDGVYNNFVPFNWATGNPQTLNPRWTKTNQVTEYNPYGFELENKDTLGIYSSALYGYQNSLATAVASNTMHRELAYDGFEDYLAPSGYPTQVIPQGHLQFTSVNPSAPISLDNTVSHTGTYSLQTASNGAAEMYTTVDHSTTGYALFNPIAGQKYHLSLWVKATDGSEGEVLVEDYTASNTLATGDPDPSMSAIDGWKQINVDFTAPAASHQIRIELSCISPTSGGAWFDDIRIQPFTSGITTYVYDPNTLWLVAELDDRNFATFYNYDEEGSLVQVKKETEKGIVTIRTSRSNIKKNQ